MASSFTLARACLRNNARRVSRADLGAHRHKMWPGGRLPDLDRSYARTAERSSASRPGQPRRTIEWNLTRRGRVRLNWSSGQVASPLWQVGPLVAVNSLNMLQPIGRTRSYEQIVTQIEDMIQEGHFRIGERMPSERALAHQFQVSRVVVREGLRHLEARRIIEVLQGSGTYVRRVPPQTLAQNVTFLLELEKSSFVDLMVVRQTLEVTAARLAATQATPRGSFGDRCLRA